MTLSTWLRDYLYIPLGGNRNGRVRTYANLAITMLLGGLWHGASWTFVLWGALHGLGLIINKLWSESRITSKTLPAPLGWLLTFCYVCFCWIFFRANSFTDAVTVIEKIIGLNSQGFAFIYSPFFMLIPIIVMAHALGHAASRMVRENDTARRFAAPYWARNIYGADTFAVTP